MLNRTCRLAAQGLQLSLTAFGLAACGGIGASPSASVGDMPSHGAVGKTMKANSEKFAQCARDSVTVQTGSTQRMQLRFVIDPTGKVTKAWVESMTAPDPDLHTCVLVNLRKMTFPVPRDKKPKDIVYPLVLKPE